MSDRLSVLREIAALEGVQRALAAIGERTDDDRRKDLIEQRRRLSAQIARVGEAADAVFAQRDDATYRIFRAKFSAMRSATALHQANWPAVRLGEDARGHAASTATAREANRDFIAWARAALDPPA